MWGGDGPRPQFVSSKANKPASSTNEAIRHAMKAMRSESARVDAQLVDDFQSVMEGECIHLSSFFCAKDDFSLVQSLMTDLAQEGREGMIDWSKHLKFENPDFSPTFQKLIQELDTYFDVEIFATRLNFYRDGTDWKPFHHDSHAFGDGGKKEDFTVGASFGASRELEFLHPQSGQKFAFPQNNGDIFAFTSEVNKRFQHGVPKARKTNVGPRFSVIAWGRRRTLNERNGGGPGVSKPNNPTLGEPLRSSSAHNAGRSHTSSQPPKHTMDTKYSDQTKEAAVSMDEVQALVQSFVSDQQVKTQVKDQRTNRRTRTPTSSQQLEANDHRTSMDRGQSNTIASGQSVTYPVTFTGSHKALVRTLKETLNRQEYTKFREASVQYQHGNLLLSSYYDMVLPLVHHRIDLLRLAANCLPDAERRNELLEHIQA
mmetsp:Transcript_25162/g.54774  ORF Transcript_25162/g.54774 Transcript_25162/m.54774 type:complete len:428 (-) Transcript_25162:204-1487(-)|eukprot:CAMPEP_0118922692 /NCGR_PEP_ID=MMETSP1169-20130426/1538_1 /TAXON_ID=36882 /ORGANISM="Pyramimonas obovata, Strain CCMP722" /LENGTH=427 /DNA_ID=CAMNT_0006863607 /DNA_START=82 /DNA_END=1365 /DNA_ORIENTATION=+